MTFRVKFFSESLRVIVRKTKVEISTNFQVFTSAVQRASSGQSVKDFSNTVFARTSRGWRITVGGLAFGRGNAKASDGRQTFKFPQNFLRADTPTDAKPFVSGWRFLPVIFFFVFDCEFILPYSSIFLFYLHFFNNTDSYFVFNMFNICRT